MKKIYIFGLFTRIFMFLSILFMIYLPINDLFSNGIKFDNLIIIIILIIFLGVVVYWQWTLGIFVNVKKNRITISFYMNKSKNVERALSDIESISLEERKNYGFVFIIKHKNGDIEKINYRFFRLVWLESIQSKRIKQKLKELNQTLK
ncbi:MAG: hypothetical protein ACI32E_07180 [Bacilli bacterium]